LWCVIEEVLLSDLSEHHEDRKTGLKQQVFLERRVEEDSAPGSPADCRSQAENSSRDGRDLELYLQKELDKHQRKNGRDRSKDMTKKCLMTRDRYSVGCVMYKVWFAVCQVHNVLFIFVPRERSPSSEIISEPKKVFSCSFPSCAKTYVKSSHLKVQESFPNLASLPEAAVNLPPGPHENPHRGEALQMSLAGLPLEVCTI
jgi:hypothetical protein